MATFRSRRLEALIGAEIVNATYAQVASLVPGATESEDLDLKATLYPTTPDGAKSCRGDVAAMANTVGGLIILGIAENGPGQAGSTPGVACADSEVRHIRQVAGNITPFLPIDVIALEDAPQSGHGFILISVPRSVMAPHAVTNGDSMKFPRRNGATTYYLSEGQVAEAYRARFSGMADRIEEAQRIEGEYVATLGSSQPFIVVTLVPDLPGEAPVDMDSFRAFQQELANRNPHIVPSQSMSFVGTSVRRRRFIATDSANTAEPIFALGCELHQSGSGSFASGVGVGDEFGSGGDVALSASGQAIVEAIASG